MYEPFCGICLTDTFQLYEKEDLLSTLLTDNSSRRQRQKSLDIKVVLGNPPYSVGQDSDNDDSANVTYPHLDESIRQTYVAASTGNPRSLYNNYIRAIRWGSNRVGDAGIVAFVSNGGWLESKAADGIRKCLAEEFSTLYVFNLRGDARTSGERRRKEKDNVFGQGARTPIAISILVKNPTPSRSTGRIQYHDIGDFLTRAEKLNIITEFGSVHSMERQGVWQTIVPNEHQDWVSQRDATVSGWMSLGDKKDKSAATAFPVYSSGVKTNRDPWAWNFSKRALLENMGSMISFYSECLKVKAHPGANDPQRISWSWLLRERLEKGDFQPFLEDKAINAIYRPFTKQWLYYDSFYNENRYLMPRLFPTGREENRVICISAPGGKLAFTALMVDAVPSLHFADMGGSQCFPLWVYDEGKPQDADLFNPTNASRRHGVSDAALSRFQGAYEDEGITKDDVFYFIYGLLHSPDYKSRFSVNLVKELPRLPLPKTRADFQSFTVAGRRLADLHLNYETADLYPLVVQGDLLPSEASETEHRVEGMKFAGSGAAKDRSTIAYNGRVTLRGIPLEAFDYVVNGKPAIEWVMEQQGVSVDRYNAVKRKGSGIINDANRYAIETVGDPAYPLKLFQRVITVSLETMKIVRSLPPLEILETAPSPVKEDA